MRDPSDLEGGEHEEGEAALRRGGARGAGRTRSRPALKRTAAKPPAGLAPRPAAPTRQTFRPRPGRPRPRPLGRPPGLPGRIAPSPFASGPRAPAGSESSAPPVVIDCHCHAGAGAGIDLGAGHPSAFARYVMRSRAAGIARTVLFAGFRPDYASANREVARLAAASPGRFLWFACVHPQRDRGRVGALLDEAIRLGAVGVKAHRRDAVLTDEVCDAARARALPILYDPRGEIDVVERFARAYPDVPFIVPHLGSFEDDVAAQRRLIDPLSSIQNLHADTSGVRAFDLLEEALRRAGPGKLLFGSDGPWLHPGVELEKVRLLRLPAEEEALVLGGNLLRLTGASLTPARPAQGSAARSA